MVILNSQYKITGNQTNVYIYNPKITIEGIK